MTDSSDKPSINEVYKEALNDLDKLVAWAKEHGADADPADTAVTMTTQMLESEHWQDRVVAMSVLGAACVELARRGFAGP